MVPGTCLVRTNSRYTSPVRSCPDLNKRSWLQSCQCFLQARHKGKESLKLIGMRGKYNNRYGKHRNVLLVGQVPVHRFRSTVMNASNSTAASANSAPFFTPLQPISTTVFTVCAGRARRRRRGIDSSSSRRMSKKALFSDFEHRYCRFTGH